MALTVGYNLDSVKVNYHARCIIEQRPFHTTFVIHTHTHTHTHTHN